MNRIVALTLALSGLLLFVVAGPNQAHAQSADDPGQVEAGQAVFEMTCAGCHGVDGTGIEGLGRPLTGIASQGERATHIESITSGKRGMPSFEGQLSPEEIEQAASYVRLTFGEAPAPSAQENELALTGAGSTGLAVVGFAMLAGGIQLVVWSRGRELN